MLKSIRAELEIYNDIIKETTITTTVTAGSIYDATVDRVNYFDNKFPIDWTSAETASNREINTTIRFTFDKAQAVVGMRLYGNVSKADYRYIDSTNMVIKGWTSPQDASNGVNFGSYSNGEQYSPGIKKIEIKVTELATDDAHAHLDYVQFLVVEDISPDKLFDITANKAMSYVADETNGGDFTLLYNKDKSDIWRDTSQNAIKDIPETITKNKICSIFVSTDTENDILFYKYITTNIVEEDGDIRIEGIDILTLLNETTYQKGIVYENGRSLYDWAVDVVNDIQLVNPNATSVDIDTSLQNIISYGYITEVSHREALRLIAEAGNVYLFVDKRGYISLSRDYRDSYDGIYQVKTSVAENSLSVEGAENIQGIIVNKYRYFPQNYAVELGYIESVVLTNEYQHFDIVYAQYPVKNNTVQLFYNGTNIQVANFHAYADRVEFDIKGDVGQSTFITVVGIPYDTANTTVSVGNTSQNTKEIKDNYLIGDYEFDDTNHAQWIANNQFDLLSNKYIYSWEDVTADLLFAPDEVNFFYQGNTDLSSLLLITSIEISMSDSDESISITGLTR